MGRLDEYEALVAVVRLGSIRGASAATGVPRSTLSRHLQHLEARLGVPLLLGEQGALHPTPRARQLAIDAARILAEVAQLEREVVQAEAPCLRITAPPSGGLPRLAALFAAFSRQHPEVALTLLGTSRFVDLVREDIHLAIRAQGPVDEEYVQVPLLQVRWGLWAQPAYLADQGTPHDLAQLVREHALVLPALSGPDFGALPVPPPSAARVALLSDDLAVLEEAVRCGVGIGVLPATAAATGREGMVPILPSHAGPPQLICAVYHVRWRRLPQIRAFLEFARAWYADT